MLIFLAMGTFFLLIANSWFWPTPDEYLYASAARSIIAGVQHKICLDCLNTEHTYLVSAIVALWQWLFKIGLFSLALVRLPIIFFSLGTIYIIWQIADKTAVEKSERSWFLWLLLLIPGFFVLSVRFLLDVPLAFGFSLLLLLLIKKSSPIFLGLVLLLILLTKEYGFFLAMPLVILAEYFDRRAENSLSLLRQLGKLAKRIAIILIPSLIAIYLLIATDFFPYPRLLETNLSEYTGPAYFTVIPTLRKLSYEQNKLTLARKSDQQKELAAATTEHAQQQSMKTEEKRDLNLSSFLPPAILSSPIEPEVKGGFWAKLWYIYKYNFSDQDLIIFSLPLFFTGLAIRLKHVLKTRKDQLLYRNDYIFLVFTSIYLFVNWHEALNIHGFRLTVPIIIPIIYFGYFGARAIIKDNNKLAKIVFLTLFLLFLEFYILFILQISDYGSVISHFLLISLLLKYKVWIFCLIFTALVVFVCLFARIKINNKYHFLALSILFLAFLKFLPFYLESKAANQTFGYDYGLPKATSTLEYLRSNQYLIAANVHTYTLDYYSGQLNLSNVGTMPAIRSFAQSNRSSFYRLYDNDLPDEGQEPSSKMIKYFLYINKSSASQPETSLYHALENQPGRFKPITDSYLNNHLQWRIYEDLFFGK